MTDPDLHVVVGSTRIDPIIRNGTEFWFRLDGRFEAVWLKSRAARPVVLGLNHDERLLGFAVQSVCIEHGGTRSEMPLNTPDLIEGFHDFEAGTGRWTNGNALLAWPEMGLPGEVFLCVKGFGLQSYAARDSNSFADAELFLQFESLGHDCEFGFVQRHFNADPHGLLRWGKTSLGTNHGWSGELLCRPRRTRSDGTRVVAGAVGIQGSR